MAEPYKDELQSWFGGALYNVCGQFNITPPTPLDGQFLPLQQDSAGNLLVNVVSGGSGSNASVGLTGATAPTSATEIGVVDSTGKLQHVTGFDLTNAFALTVAIVDGSGNQITSFGGGVQFADAAASGAHPTGTQIIGWNKGATTELAITALSLTNAQPLEVAVVDGSGTQVVTFVDVQYADSAAIAHATEAFVQGNNVANQSGVTVPVSYLSNNAAGNLLVLVVRSSSAADVTSVTDTAGNTWIKVDEGNITDLTSFWYAANSVAGSNTVTAHFNGSATSVYLAIGEYSGIQVVNPLDTHNVAVNNSGSTTPTSPAVNALAGDLVIGWSGNHAGETYSAGSGFLLRESNIGEAFEDQLNVAAGSYTATFSMSGSTSWICGIATFKAASTSVSETGTLAMAADLTNFRIRSLTVDTNQNLFVNVNAALPAGTNVIGHVIVDSGAVTVSGTVTSNQGTAAALAGAWPVEVTDGANVLGTSTHPIRIDPTGTTAQPVSESGLWNVNQAIGVAGFEKITDGTNTAAVKASNSAAVITDPALVVSLSPNSAVSIKTGGTVSNWTGLNLAGLNPGHVVIIDSSGSGTVPAVKAASTAAVAADPALVVAISPNNTIPSNITQWASTVLGVPQTFGTVPTGVVVGTSSDIYVSGTRARSNQTTTAAGVQDVNITGVLGVTNSVTNGLFCAITDNTTKVGVIVGTTALKTDMSSVAGTATVTAAAGVQKVGIVGNTGAVLDAVITAATAPPNAQAILSVNQTTAPSLTVGQSVALQSDYQGSVFVKPYRRGQTVAKATTISATTATTVLAAQAAGIFADISHFSLSAVPIATSVATTATLSDGTNSYIFDFIPGTATASGSDQALIFEFNPPLPAATAATAWTVTMSTANTVHVKVVAVLQKAS